MSVIDRQTLNQLAAVQGPGCLVSLYLPTHRTGREIRQGPIRLKNLLRQAGEELQACGLSSREIDEVLAPATALIERGPFWEHQQDGLALFLEPSGLREFRCPRHFDELCYVHDHFHLKPLLPLLRNEASFHLLALSLGQVKLFEVTDTGLAELDLGPIPDSLSSALGHDLEEPTLGHHAATRPGHGPEDSVFHGQGVGDDDRDEEVHQFLLRVASGLQERLPENGTPLMLIAVDKLAAQFRKVSRRQSILEDGLSGSLASYDPQRLHAEAWELARPTLERDANAAAERFIELRGTDRAAAKLKDIGPAVATGRVESLLVAADRHVWGRLAEDGSIEVHDERQRGDVDVLDRLAMLGLDTGADVIARRAARLPDGTAAAAVLRY